MQRHHSHGKSPSNFLRGINVTKKHYAKALELTTLLRLTIMRNPGKPLIDVINAVTNDDKLRTLLPIVWPQRWGDLALLDFHLAVANGKAPLNAKPKGLDSWKALMYMIDETKVVSESA